MENSKDNNNFCRNVVLSLKACKEMICGTSSSPFSEAPLNQNYTLL